MYSCTSADSYLESFVIKSSASRTFTSTGSGPPRDSSPPGGSAPFAGLHDNVTLLFFPPDLSSCHKQGAYSSCTITTAYVIMRLV